MRHSGRYIAPRRPKREELIAYNKFMKKDGKMAAKTDEKMPGENTEVESPQVRRVSGGNFVSLTEKDENVCGFYQGYSWGVIISRGEEIPTRKHRIIDNNGELIEFMDKFQLAEILPRVPLGAYISITHTGKEKTASGSTVNTFTIDLQEGVDLLPPTEQKKKVSLFAPNGQALKYEDSEE